MNTILKHPLVAPLIAAGALGSAFAGELTGPVAEVPAAAEAGSWEFRLQPYGWLTGLDGTTGVGPLVVDIDQSFSDIIDNIEMAAALQFEARNGRWGIIADGFYADLGGSGNSPGPLYDEVKVGLKQFIGELAVAYRVYESPSAFVDVYGGMRYNNLSLDFSATLDTAGIQAVSEAASGRIVNGVAEKAGAIVDPKVASYKAGSAASRAAIESQVISAIEAEADGRVKRDLEKQLVRIRREGGLDARDIASNRIVRAVKSERLALARSTAQLKVAQLRAAVDSSLQGGVARARTRVSQDEKQLAAAINSQLVNGLPTSASADKDWVDPFIGVRAQWNLTDKWFLAGKSDIGGFSVGSDLAWSLQGTAGYRFTEKVSAEVGYRYLDTDYEDGAFSYDIAEHGFFLGLNVAF
jgi:opacity protein-like surface antigen